VYEASDNLRAASANVRDVSTTNTSSDIRSIEASSRVSRELVIVDSGSELSLGPNDIVDMNTVRSTTQKVFAANGTPIQVQCNW